MPRQNKVWRRKQNSWYYRKIAGKQVRLSQNRGEAEKVMHTILSQQEAEDTVNTKVLPTFRKMADRYLQNSERVN
jgi:hypothetical protein